MIFVTGGTGLVGSHLLYALTSQGQKVRALRRSASGNQFVKKVFGYYTSQADELLSLIEWVEGDLLDLPEPEEWLTDIDQVYHCAAMVSFSRKDKYAMLENNIEGTARIVDACLQRPGIRLCFVSSIAAIGRPSDGEMVTEDHRWKPSRNHSAYSVSKFRSELEVWRGITEGLDAVIVNPSVILGPGKWSSGSSSFFHFVYKGLKFYTSGITGFVDVIDVVNAMIILMNSKVVGQRFILNSENISFHELFTSIAIALHKKPPLWYAHPWMTRQAAIWGRILSFWTGKQTSLTRETIRSAYSVTRYSNEKVKNFTGMEFKKIEDSIRSNARLYLQDMVVEY